MAKWEYKKVKVNYGVEEQYLNKLGQEGWEMCGTYNDGFVIMVFFKRKIED